MVELLKDIKIYKYKAEYYDYYMIGQVWKSGYILHTNDFIDDKYYIGTTMGCVRGNELSNDDQVTIDLERLSELGIYLTLDNRLFIRNSNLLIDLNKKAIYILTEKESENISNGKFSSKKLIVLKNS
jgi:hypothetical protein